MRYDDEYFARCSYMSMLVPLSHNTAPPRPPIVPSPSLSPHKVRALSHIHARVVPVVSSLRARAMLAPTHSLSHLDDCENIFIDVGANSGDSMAKWYSQISCYENCMERRNFKHLWQDPCLPANETCGKDASCEAVKNTCFCQSQLQKGCGWEWPYWFPRAVRRSYCGIAFEPNPALSDKLHHRARELKRSGAAPKIKVFNGTALSVRDGYAQFGVDVKWTTGSSLVLDKRKMDDHGKAGRGGFVNETQVSVRTLDAVSFVRSLKAKRISIKLDVEGSEFEILRDLIVSGTLCQRVDNIWIEWHGAGRINWKTMGLPTSEKEMQKVYTWMIRSVGNRKIILPEHLSPHCRTFMGTWA